MTPTRAELIDELRSKLACGWFCGRRAIMVRAALAEIDELREQIKELRDRRWFHRENYDLRRPS